MKNLHDFTPHSTVQHPVYLVGAGPGDPDLLTLKAAKAIAQATVILVDDLVSDEVLAHKNPRARVTYVGKRGGCASTPQAFIEKRMVQEAKRGERVVRLKGGDPLIFGRSGEEIAALTQAGLAFEVINGITSGLAAATSLGIPLTHRDHAHGVLWMTGHAQAGGEPSDWARVGLLAQELSLTLVVYMGLTYAADIQSGLVAGLPAQTPVAFVHRVSAAAERVYFSTLSTMNEAIAQHQIKSPSIMVIGKVVADAVQYDNAVSAVAHSQLQALHQQVQARYGS